MRVLKHHRTFEVALHQAGLGPVAGVDEAGRGACAGPITIAACILPPQPLAALSRLTDSKKLSAATRAALFPLIQHHAVAWSILHISAADIDQYGIQHANVFGMRRAVALLDVQPGYVLTVLAKHARDLVMVELAETYPRYEFASHKGYGTKVHMTAVRRYGASPVHRYSYANVAAAHSEWLGQTPTHTQKPTPGEAHTTAGGEQFLF